MIPLELRGLGRSIVIVSWFIVLSLTSSCALAQEVAPLAEHDGYQGAWLRNDVAEVFVAVEPAFRLLSFREVGETSLQAGSDTAEAGMRLAFMEPDQGPDSFKVGAQAGEFLEWTESSATVRLGGAAGLHYEVSLALDDAAPRLAATYRLYNDGDEPRTYACWSVFAFARKGTIVMPFDQAPRSRRRLVLPFWGVWPQPGVRIDRRALVADAGAPLTGNTYKVGVITDAGWIAFLRDGQALVTHSPFDPAATYPDGGANITAFVFDQNDGGRAWAEIERLGPLQRVQPGDYAELHETVTLIDLPNDPAAADDPNELRKQIDAAR